MHARAPLLYYVKLLAMLCHDNCCMMGCLLVNAQQVVAREAVEIIIKQSGMQAV